MNRIRTVKPELFRHEQLFEAEKKYHLPLRLAFIGLFTCCDREGRFRWKPRQLKLDVLPYDDLNMSDILDALAAAGFIVQYEVQGQRYGYIPSWSKHQHINIRESISVLPDVKAGILISGLENNVSSSCTCMHVQTYTQPISARELHVKENLVTTTVITEKSATDFHADVNEMKSGENFDATRLPPTTQYSPPVSRDQPAEILNSTCNLPASDSNHFEACPALFSSEAGACTCIHMGKGKGTGMGSGKGTGTGTEREREKKEGMGANRNIVAPARRQSVITTDALAVFDFWKTTFQHPQAVLDPKRQRLIRQALRCGYSVAQLCDAISGCSQTPHNMGDNDRGQRYDGLHIILRDSDQIERFMRHHHNPPQPPSPSDKLLQTSVDAATKWLNQKKRTGAKS